MSLPFKIKKMAISGIDSSFLIDEVVSSIAKIKKQKQRPNSERIFSMMVKSHPELTLSCLNEAIDKAIHDGLVINYLHNGVYSYRVVPTSSESDNKFISDRSVEEAVKWLFYDGKPRQFNLDELECSVRQRFPAGSLFSSCLRDVILNVCTELVQLGELTYAKGIYTKSAAECQNEKDFKQFNCINNNNIKSGSFASHSPQSCDVIKKTEPPDIRCSPNDNFVKSTEHADADLSSDTEDLNDTHISSKETFSNLQSPLSDVSSDKPKRKKARSLQVSFLYDSLSNFFSVSGDRRRTSKSYVEKSFISNASQESKSSRHSVASRPHITKKASKRASSKRTSDSSDWLPTSVHPIKKKCGLPSKNGRKSNAKHSSNFDHETHSHNFQKTSSILHSTLEEIDFNEVNLASVNIGDKDFFDNLKSLEKEGSGSNQANELAFGRFLLLINSASVLPKMKSKRLVMCEFCLQILDSSRSLERHLMKCGLHCPPGNEMYRFNDIKLFHLAGQDQPVYSKRLDRLLHLLYPVDHNHLSHLSNGNISLNSISMDGDLSSLPSFEELNHFVLTIQDRSGSHLAGILSYHNKVDGQWIVTCLFVMPQYRNQGHAKCLVNLVYRMASLHGGEVTLKLNIPLNNHVLNLFQSVWRSLIVDYLINVEAQRLHFQLEDIAKATSVELKDVTSSLSSLKMESDFYLTEQAVDMTHSQKEEMRRDSESHLLLSSLELPFNNKCCEIFKEILKSKRLTNDDLDTSSYQERHVLVKSSSQNSDVLERQWKLLSSLGVNTKTKICDGSTEDVPEINTKRKHDEEVFENDENPCKKFHHSDGDDDVTRHEVEEKNSHAEQNQTESLDDQRQEIPMEDSNVENEIVNDAEMTPDEDSNTKESRDGELFDRVEEFKSSGKSDRDMPSLDDQAGSPSTAASSLGVATSSPSPPALRRESKDEVTVVSSVRSDHSEVDVGGPTCSPTKGHSSLPSSVKNVASHCSVEEDQPLNSVKNNHEDDDCTVVAIETVTHNSCPSSCAEPPNSFHQSSKHYHHHHGNMSNNMEKRMHHQIEHDKNFCNDIPQYDVPKEHHQSPSYFEIPNHQDAPLNRQCQSVAPGICNSKSGKSKKTSKQIDDAGYCGPTGERMNDKIVSGMNSMQERCNSVFADPSHYPPLSLNQGPGNGQSFQRPLDYIDGRIDRPATRCGFESSFPQPFNAEFSSRFVNPQPPNLELNIGYQMQDRNIQPSCMPGAKLNQPGSFSSNRSQSAMNKTSKRSGKSQGIPPPVCYASTKSSNVPTNSPTIGGTLPMPSEPLLNAIYRFPNMTQGFEIPCPGYGLPNRFSSDSNKSNFVPPNTYFGQQSSPPGSCQIQSQHNSNQSHSQHVNRGNGNASDSVLHHRPSDESSHQQALFLQHQRQQQAAYLNPAAYFAKLHQFHSEFGQFQYSAPFHSSSSPTPIDMSLHMPSRPSMVDGKAALLGMQQQHRDSIPEVDFFQSYKMFNLGPYAGSVDPRNIVHRNTQNQVGIFSHQQQSQLESGIQSPYSAYLNGGNRVGNDLFTNSNLSDLMRK